MSSVQGFPFWQSYVGAETRTPTRLNLERGMCPLELGGVELPWNLFAGHPYALLAVLRYWYAVWHTRPRLSSSRWHGVWIARCHFYGRSHAERWKPAPDRAPRARCECLGREDPRPPE